MLLSTYNVAFMIQRVTDSITNKVKQLENKFGAWFLIVLAVLLVLAFTIASALAIWCVVEKGGSFTGKWYWYRWGVSVKAECV